MTWNCHEPSAEVRAAFARNTSFYQLNNLHGGDIASLRGAAHPQIAVSRFKVILKCLEENQSDAEMCCTSPICKAKGNDRNSQNVKIASAAYFCIRLRATAQPSS